MKASTFRSPAGSRSSLRRTARASLRLSKQCAGVCLDGQVTALRGAPCEPADESATVELLLELPRQGTVRLTRTLKRSGATTFTANAGDVAVSESEYLAILGEAWAAEPAVLDSVIFGSPATSKVTPFPVRDHLAAIFGIEPLLGGAAAVGARRDMLAARIKTLRDDLSGTTEAIEAAARTVARACSERRSDRGSPRRGQRSYRSA